MRAAYPIKIPGEVSVENKPLLLGAPSLLVREAQPLLPPQAYVLDAGSHSGRNAFFLADYGHNVDAVEIDPDAIENGRRIACALYKPENKTPKFICDDITRLRFHPRYDAVIGIGVLHELKNEHAHSTLGKFRAAIKQGGLNILEAYIATPDQQAEMPNFAFFQPEELEGIYRSLGWAVLKYSEVLKPLGMADGKPMNRSRAELIAQKPEVRSLFHDLHSQS